MPATAEEGFVQGPICPGWYEEPDGPDDLGCAHGTCAAIAYMGPLPHDCPYDNFLNDPITIAYGAQDCIDLISCPVCDAATEEAWENRTHRRNI